MKSVYVAYTGGTIGMKDTAQGYAPVPGYLSDALKAQPEFQDESLPDIHVHEYYRAPSSWHRDQESTKEQLLLLRGR